MSKRVETKSTPKKPQMKADTSYRPRHEKCLCGNKILTMAFKGTGVCSNKCEKKFGEVKDKSNVPTATLKAKLDELESPKYASKVKAFDRGLNFATKEIRKILK